MFHSTAGLRTFDSAQPALRQGVPAGLASQVADPVQSATRELASSWERGDRQPVEYFLHQNPQLLDNSEAAVALVYEEYCLREELGEAVTTDEYHERFPEWQAELEVLFQCHQLIEPQGQTVQFPQPGERLGEFQLLSELGRGAQGRVYLARQALLGNRLVVLKVTGQFCGEPLSLSRLQHTHIVPLYCVLDDPERNLSAFCMPYVGGATLERILAAFSPRPIQERKGKDILAVLDQQHETVSAAAPHNGRTCSFLENASYERAVAWIVACLAEALAYMHQCGLLHMDIKPSNVLIAGDGQPMLIDFHLAREPLEAGTTVPGGLGGTRYYMSPEQRQAIDAVIHADPIPVDVDGRSDVYSLGLVLYEALSGRTPAGKEPEIVPLRQLNPNVSPGLSDIVDRCLAAEPGRRYGDASSLAADLRRHLTHLPLRVAGNRSLVERWTKWRRRRPYGPALLAMLLLITIAAAGSCLFGWLHVQGRISLAQSRLAEARRLDAAGDYAQALRALQAGRHETEGIPGTVSVRQRLSVELKSVRRHVLARRLSETVDRLRLLEGFENAPNSQLEDLYASCLEVWEKRDRLNASANGPRSRRVDQEMRTNLLDLGILMADLRARLSEDINARYEALTILDDTEELFGTSSALEVQRFYHADAAGLTEQAQAAERRAEKLVPTTAWEHQALGRWLLGRGKLQQAERHFQSAIRLKPDLFWPHFFRAICAHRLEEYSLAVQELGVCIALNPVRPECYHNRALAFTALGRHDEAFDDLNRALELSPNFAPARRQLDELRQACASAF